MLDFKSYTTFCKQTNLVFLTLALTLTRSSLISKRLFHARKCNTCKPFSGLRYLSILLKMRRTIKLIKVKSTSWET